MNIKLEFKVERSLGDPLIKIMVDDTMNTFDGACPDEISFDIPVTVGQHELRITHYGKKNEDHVLDSHGNILVDKHVELTGLWFDGIELKEELWNGDFFPVYNPDYIKDLKSKGVTIPYSIRPNLYFGHNGMWQLSFSYPVANWLIKVRQEKLAIKVNPDFVSREEELFKVKSYFDSAPDLEW